MWEFLNEHWRHGVEILILAALAYHGYLFFRATRGARILTGLLVLLLSLTLISQLLELGVINSLIQGFSVFLVVGMVVLFQQSVCPLIHYHRNGFFSGRLAFQMCVIPSPPRQKASSPAAASRRPSGLQAASAPLKKSFL